MEVTSVSASSDEDVSTGPRRASPTPLLKLLKLTEMGLGKKGFQKKKGETYWMGTAMVMLEMSAAEAAPVKKVCRILDWQIKRYFQIMINRSEIAC